jgi:hypothetical protein
MNFRQVWVFPMPPIPYSRKIFLGESSPGCLSKKVLSCAKWSPRPVKVVTEEPLGLYSILGIDFLLEISPILAVRIRRKGA